MPRVARSWDALSRFGHPSVVVGNNSYRAGHDAIWYGYNLGTNVLMLSGHRNVLGCALTFGRPLVRLMSWGPNDFNHCFVVCASIVGAGMSA